MRYFAAADVVLPPEGGPVEAGIYAIEPRRWSVGIFDWAYIQTTSPHRLLIPYQLADALSARVNLEPTVEADSFAEASQKLDLLYLGLLANNVLPFSMPYISTHSLNCLSNISSPQESDDERQKLGAPLRDASETYEARWLRPDLRIYGTGTGASPDISEETFRAAASAANAWEQIESQEGVAAALRRAFTSAPAVEPSSMGLMLIWTALESLFPRVSSEIAYRLSLNLAQFCAEGSASLAEVKRLRSMYKVRSKVAHGGDATESEWAATWALGIDVVNAVIRRRGVPNEDTLLGELLA